MTITLNISDKIIKKVAKEMGFPFEEAKTIIAEYLQSEYADDSIVLEETLENMFNF